MGCTQLPLPFKSATLQIRYLANPLPCNSATLQMRYLIKIRYPIEKLIIPMRKNISAYTFNRMITHAPD